MGQFFGVHDIIGFSLTKELQVKFLLIFGLSFFTATGFAAIRLATELSYGGKKIAPAVTLRSGETAILNQDDFTIQVKAKEQGKKAALLYFKIFETKDGVEKLLASPSVMASFGHEAMISQAATGQTGAMSLKVTPTWKASSGRRH